MKLADHNDRSAEVCDVTSAFLFLAYLTKSCRGQVGDHTEKHLSCTSIFRNMYLLCFVPLRWEKLYLFAGNPLLQPRRNKRYFRTSAGKCLGQWAADVKTLTQNAAVEIWKHWQAIYLKIFFCKGVTDSDSQCAATAARVKCAYRQIYSTINLWLQQENSFKFGFLTTQSLTFYFKNPKKLF